MATKKKQAKNKPAAIISDVFNRSIEIIGDLAGATAASSINASLTSARYLVKFQKSSAKAGLDVVAKVQEYTEKSLRNAMKEAEWAPEEGKDVVDEWAKMMGSGIDEFNRVIDKSFDLVLKLIDRIEKERKEKAKPKETASASPAPKKSKAKPAAKPKTTAKKKSATTS